MRFLTFLLTLMFAVSAFSPLPVSAERLSRTVKFEQPDIKDAFCGARIDYKICKCSFHNEMCKEIGRTRSVASYILNSKYGAYVSQLRIGFIASCVAGGGKYAEDRCEYYEKTKDEKECLPGDFDAQWKKYSDIDDRIPPSERSFEAKQHYDALAKVVNNSQELFLLGRDMEIDRQARLEVKQYKQALVKNIKTNLLKSFWRLAWITYDNIQSGRSSSGTFEKMYDLPSHMESIAAYLKTVRSVTPGDSVIAINTDSIAGKAKNVGLSVAFDAMESVGDPVTVATTLISESVKQTFGSADITPEEIEILKTQHLKNNLLDDIIQESYRRNRERRLKAESLKSENETLKTQLLELENKEKDRTRKELVDACEKK
ncbi:MAG: hypothetical protein AAB630_00660 [Patescibacteria group bacterium]